MDAGRAIEAAALIMAAAAAGWAAAACRGARRDGLECADARIWTILALLYLALACARGAHVGPWFGGEMRRLARAASLYGDRRPFQIVASLSLASFALVALAVGLRFAWQALKRYRLAASCVAVVLASALIRFVSLHEVDAWNEAWPWGRVTIDVGTSALATAVALARVRQIARSRAPAGWRHVAS